MFKVEDKVQLVKDVCFGSQLIIKSGSIGTIISTQGDTTDAYEIKWNNPLDQETHQAYINILLTPKIRYEYKFLALLKINRWENLE